MGTIMPTTITGTATRMITDTLAVSPADMALLAAWGSPACPVGAFSYSHGLERLEADGLMGDAAATQAAIEGVLRHGAGRVDAVLLAKAYGAADWRTVNTLALALAPSAERRAETVVQGTSFAKLIDAVWPLSEPLSGGEVAHPVAFGVAGRGHGIALEPLCLSYLLAFSANLVSAAVRLVPLGQTDGQRITAALAGVAVEVTRAAIDAAEDDVGSAAIALDIAAMRHETQHVRLFRS